MNPLSSRACPDCSAPLGRAPPARARVGPPFEECPRCSALVATPGAREWDVLAPVQRLSWMGWQLAPWAGLLALPAVLYAAIAFDGRPGQLEMLLGLSACAAFLFLSLPLPATLRAIRRSRARMADPMYRARLVKFERGAAGGRGATPP